jgi:hypothetical protein
MQRNREIVYRSSVSFFVSINYYRLLLQDVGLTESRDLVLGVLHKSKVQLARKTLTI